MAWTVTPPPALAEPCLRAVCAGASLPASLPAGLQARGAAGPFRSRRHFSRKRGLACASVVAAQAVGEAGASPGQSCPRGPAGALLPAGAAGARAEPAAWGEHVPLPSPPPSPCLQGRAALTAGPDREVGKDRLEGSQTQVPPGAWIWLRSTAVRTSEAPGLIASSHPSSPGRSPLPPHRRWALEPGAEAGGGPRGGVPRGLPAAAMRGPVWKSRLHGPLSPPPPSTGQQSGLSGSPGPGTHSRRGGWTGPN